jgi:hypothetical protein
VLLGYLQVAIDHGIHEMEDPEHEFESGVVEVIAKLYSLVVEPRLLWDISKKE